MIDFLANNQLLLLFLICAIGYGLGSLKLPFGGPKIGIAATLFVALGFGAFGKKLQLPTIVDSIGLALFMYPLGLSTSQGIGAVLSKRGRRESVVALSIIIVGAIVFAFVASIIHGDSGFKAALYAGIMSNSTGLAAIIDAGRRAGLSPDRMQNIVVGFAISYPTSMLAPLIAMIVAKTVSGVDPLAEAKSDREYVRSQLPLWTKRILVEKADATQVELADLTIHEGELRPSVVVGAVQKGDAYTLANGAQFLEIGDIVEAVGVESDLELFAHRLGSTLESEPGLGRFETRRVYVSNSELAGIPLTKLNLIHKLGLKILRVRRGDGEFIPDERTRLELGDRIRVLSLKENADEIRRLFGDSLTAVSEVDFLSFGLGITLGLLLGLATIPVGGGITVGLGFAGGPLVAGLILGKLDRSGPIVWNLPYSSNVLLRQLGLMLFCAGIGIRSGYGLLQSLERGNGFESLAIALAFGLVLGLAGLFAGLKWAKLGFNRSCGVYCGALTQPVILDFATGYSGNELAATPYAAVFPVCIVTKIIICQLLFVFLR